MNQLGAICYLLWGLLHLVASFQVFTLGKGQNSGMVQGRLYQNAWNLASLAIAVVVIAVVYNWNNSLVGYWLNLGMSTITDMGFVLFIVAPRYLPLRFSLPGPVLWMLAVLFSTLGILSSRI